MVKEILLNKIENTKVIYLNARCIFGGINIK